MGSYVVKVELEVEVDRGERSISYETYKKEELSSRVLDFPNNVEIGQKLILGKDVYKVADVYHKPEQRHSIIYLEKKKSQQITKEEAEEALQEMVKKYAFLKEL